MQAGDAPGGCPGAAGGGHDKHGAAASFRLFNLTEGAAAVEEWWRKKRKALVT